jgi:CheY-like chemotaxis protein
MQTPGLSEVRNLPDPFWKILVVDDEPAIHQVTKLALRSLTVLDKPCQLINALSAKDAREELARHPDVAVALLDVVMETDSAGLDLVRYIRDELGNSQLRIILRTGQAGQAPERRVMVDYDINDYKEKTELTSNKLFTVVLANVRTFHHIRSMEKLREGVHALGTLNTHLYAAQDVPQLQQALVRQFLLLKIFSAVGCSTGAGASACQVADGALPPLDAFHGVAQWERGMPEVPVSAQGLSLLHLQTAGGVRCQLYLAQAEAMSPHTAYLLHVLADSAAVAVGRWSPAV